MAWIRLEDTFPEHRKIDAAGGDAAWLHVCALGYCNRNRTDGVIPRERVGRLSDRKNPLRLADKLVEAGLWETHENGYLIHDYLDYNPTRAELDSADSERTRKKAEAGKLGGIASGIARRKHKGSTSEANREPNTNEIEAPPHPTPSHPIPKNHASDSSVNSRAHREQPKTDDDVAMQALKLLAAQWADQHAKPAKHRAYVGSVMANADDHLPALRTLHAERPEATPEQVADAYDAGSWPEVINPARPNHPSTCECDGNGWITSPDGDHVIRCPHTEWADATVLHLRGAS